MYGVQRKFVEIYIRCETLTLHHHFRKTCDRFDQNPMC